MKGVCGGSDYTLEGTVWDVELPGMQQWNNCNATEYSGIWVG